MHFARLRIGLLILFGISGCGVTQNQRPVTMANAAAPEVAIPDPESARSKRVETQPVLTRDALIRAVLAQNPSVTAARAAWRAAQARRSQRSAAEDPMLSYSFAPLSIGSGMRYGQEIELSQRFPWPGKLDSLASEAQAEADGEAAHYATLRLDLALATSLLFDDYYVTARALEINQHHRNLMSEIAQSAAARYGVGRGSLQDPLQAEAELVQLQQEKIMLETEQRVTEARINALLHRAPDAKLPPPPERLDVVREQPRASSILQRDAVAQRSEIRATESQIRAAAARSESADSSFYPDLTLMLSYNSMWDAVEHQFMVGISAPIPIQRAARGGAVDEARAHSEQARYALLAQKAEVQKDVTIARARLVQALEIAVLYERKLLPLGRDRLAAARTGFESNANDFGALIEAENGLRKLELDLQIAVANVSKARAELARALGELPTSSPTRRAP